MPVATVVTVVADGLMTDEIMAEHPGLTPEDIREALLYAAEAAREGQLPLRHPRGWSEFRLNKSILLTMTIADTGAAVRGHDRFGPCLPRSTALGRAAGRPDS